VRTDLAGQRGTGLVDLLDGVLDKGPLMGIDLITVEARAVVASIDTYLKYSESMAHVAPVSRPAAVISQEVVLAENAALGAQLAATPSGATRPRVARRRRTPQPA
jgi:gas vesicle structural protein